MTPSDRTRIIDTDDFVATAAAAIGEAIAAAIERGGRCALALTGGDTPRPIYERLAAPPLADGINWGRVGVWFGDERCVPPDDPESNYRLAHESLLSRVPIPPAAVQRIEGERADRDAAARDYESTLPRRFDVALFGVGEDGHMASLFPGAASLEETERRVLAVQGPTSPRDRLTITPPVIRAAARVIVIVSGTKKAAAVARALEGPYDPMAVPIQLALDGTWILDRAAASALATPAT